MPTVDLNIDELDKQKIDKLAEKHGVDDVYETLEAQFTKIVRVLYDRDRKGQLQSKEDVEDEARDEE